MRFTIEDATGDCLCFDGHVVAQATDVRPRGADRLLIARVFVTAARQWVFQLVCHTWVRGEVGWSAAWTYATSHEAQRDVARRLSEFPLLARVLFERLGWRAQVGSRTPAAPSASCATPTRQEVLRDDR